MILSFVLVKNLRCCHWCRWNLVHVNLDVARTSLKQIQHVRTDVFLNYQIIFTSTGIVQSDMITLFYWNRCEFDYVCLLRLTCFLTSLYVWWKIFRSPSFYTVCDWSCRSPLSLKRMFTLIDKCRCFSFNGVCFTAFSPKRNRFIFLHPTLASVVEISLKNLRKRVIHYVSIVEDVCLQFTSVLKRYLLEHA